MSKREFKEFISGFIVSAWVGYMLFIVITSNPIHFFILIVNILLTIYGIYLIKNYG